MSAAENLKQALAGLPRDTHNRTQQVRHGMHFEHAVQVQLPAGEVVALCRSAVPPPGDAEAARIVADLSSACGKVPADTVVSFLADDAWLLLDCQPDAS